MAVVKENTGSGQSATATNHTITLGFTATANRLLIVGFGNSAAGTTFSGLGAGWNLIHDNTGSTRNMSGGFAYKISTGGETTFAITISASGTLEWGALEYSGLATSSVLDQSAENEAQNTSSAANVATGTTATLATSTGFAVGFWFADGVAWGGGSRTYTNGSTEALAWTGGAVPIIFAHKQLSATTGFTETLNSGTAGDQCYGSVAVFNQAVAGGFFGRVYYDMIGQQRFGS